jgi:hypothetical protein
MSHETKNDELRDDRLDQEQRRQEIRDEVFEDTAGEGDDLGSQDERRKEGRDAPDLHALRDDTRGKR